MISKEIRAKYERECAKQLYLVGFDEYGSLWDDKPKGTPEPKEEKEENEKWNFD